MSKFLTALLITMGFMQSAQAALMTEDAIDICTCAGDVAYTSSRMVHEDVELHEVLKVANETFKQQNDKGMNQYMKRTIINAYNHKNVSPEAMRDMTLTACLKTPR